MLNLDAAVHDRVHACVAGQGVGLQVPHPNLLPKAFGTDLDRLLRNRQHVFGATKHVDHIHGKGNVGQRRIAVLTEHIGGRIRVTRIHRDDAVPMVLHVLCREETGAVPFSRQTNDGDGADLMENPANLFNGVHGMRSQFTSSGPERVLPSWRGHILWRQPDIPTRAQCRLGRGI